MVLVWDFLGLLLFSKKQTNYKRKEVMASASVKTILESLRKSKVISNVDKLSSSILLSDQGIDSLDLSGILLNIEETFDIEIPDEDVDGIQTIDDIVIYLNKKK